MYDNETADFDRSTAVVLGSGSVEYSAAEAVADIDEVIEALQQAKNDGAVHVLLASGNYRGAQWQKLYSSVTWLDDEE